jgi:hypothetical protein
MQPFSDHERRQHEERETHLLRELVRLAGQQVLILSDIRALLKHKSILVKARIIIMPKTIAVGGTALAIIQGLDQNGKPFPLDATYPTAYTAANPSNVSFGPVSPDGSDTITGVAADPGDSIGANITRPDGVVIAATPDVLTITAPVPVLTSAAVVLQ